MRLAFWGLSFLFVTAGGCASSDSLFSPQVLATVDLGTTYPQVKETPSAHQGKTLIIGGEVLAAKRFRDHTRLTILQLPLGATKRPTSDRTQTQGRFMAIQKEFLDPATVPPGSRVTLVGTLTGSITEPLDEMDYTYPVLTIRELKVWPQAVQPPCSRPPCGYGPYGFSPYYPRYYWYPAVWYYPYWW